MNIETKRINDSRTCQDFQSGLRDRVEMRGYLTPRVDQFLYYLSQNCSMFTEQAMANIGQQAVALTQDRKTPLQSLYVVGNLLRGFDFRREELEEIGRNTATILDDTYRRILSQDEQSVDTRMIGWSVLEEVSAKVSDPLKKYILDLSYRVGGLDHEDGFIQSRALELALKLMTPQK